MSLEQPSFHAGIGRVNITPPLSAPHAGWGAQTHIFPEGVETDLWGTVLVVDDGEQRAAFVDLDLCIVSRQESNAIRQAVAQTLDIPISAVRLSVTHTHAGPPPSSWNWVPKGIDVLQQYYAFLPSLVAGAARMALLHLKPAHVGVGQGQCSVAVNRRETAPCGRTVTGVNFEGPIDEQVMVVRIDGIDRQPIAAIVGYTMHPTTMGPRFRLISADWPGHLKRTVEALTGATCLFAQGAAGDIGPGPEGYTDDPRVIRRLGARIGAVAAEVYFGLAVPPVTYRHKQVLESGAPLGVWVAEESLGPRPMVRTVTEMIELPLRAQPSLEEARAAVDEAVRRLHELVQSGTSQSAIEAATFVAKRATMTLSRAEIFGGHDTFPIELHILRIGPAVFAGVECEPFCAIGKSVKARSPFPNTWFGGYTGGWFGYVPTPEEFPRHGYEVDTSPFTPEAAAVLADSTIAALKKLAEED